MGSKMVAGRLATKASRSDALTTARRVKYGFCTAKSKIRWMPRIAGLLNPLCRKNVRVLTPRPRPPDNGTTSLMCPIKDFQ
jgi:hypothetical protein